MAQETAYTRYAKKNLVAVQFRLNRKTDADVLEWLDNCGNKQGEVKRLIREEIARTKK